MFGTIAEAPKLDGLGIVLTPPPSETLAWGAEIVVRGTALLPEADGPPNWWLRSMFLTCVREEIAASWSVNLQKDRIVFPTDVESRMLHTGSAFWILLSFELGAELGTQLPAGRYHVQVSARPHLSNVIGFQVK